ECAVLYDELRKAGTRRVANVKSAPLARGTAERPHSSGFARRSLRPKALVLADEVAGGNANFLFGIGDGASDRLRVPTVPLENSERGIDRIRRDDVAEADAHIENFEHLVIGHAAAALDQGEDRMRLDQPVDFKANGRVDADQIEQAVAGDVDQRLDAFDAR